VAFLEDEVVNLQFLIVQASRIPRFAFQGSTFTETQEILKESSFEVFARVDYNVNLVFPNDKAIILTLVCPSRNEKQRLRRTEEPLTTNAANWSSCADGSSSKNCRTCILVLSSMFTLDSYTGLNVKHEK